MDEARISPYTKEEGERALARLPLLQQFREEELSKRDSDPFQPQIDAMLKQWKKTGDPEDLLDLIGLGSGSTPSGDDVLVGMLVATAAFGETQLRHKLHSFEFRTQTHSVST